MTRTSRFLYLLLLAIGLLGPLLLPQIASQITFLWIMVIFALAWDIMGGRMGYNSFGNILFFGIGCYTLAVFQRDVDFGGYWVSLPIGLLLGGVLAVIAAVVLGAGILGLREQYFAVGTLGLGFAAGEIAASWQYIGAGGGLSTPLMPVAGNANVWWAYIAFVVAVLTFFALKRLYAGRIGLALNAIRDDEDKAEAMGLPTTRVKTMAWAVSAFPLGIAGGIVGNMQGFIDPRDIAFAGPTYGVWMILMVILGGRGTLWGPVLGAFVFQITKELFWVYLAEWQRVALGLMIVLIVVFFPQGILGWARERWPHWFGRRVVEA
jgi:branched-chain amino acid transport system permease protein